MTTTNPTTDLLGLSELESDDPELIPDILPVDARLSVKGPVSAFLSLFDRAASIIPVKEVIVGTSYAQLEGIQATGGTVAQARLTATDGDKSLSVLTDGIVVNMAGSVLVPGRKFHEILKAAPDPQVKIEVLGNVATIRSGRAVWNVQLPLGDVLPSLPDTQGTEMHDVAVDGFLAALRVARAAASTTSARPSLMQVKITQGYATGTDGGRLHRQTIEGFPTDLILDIPVKVADELIRLLKTTDAEVVSVGSGTYHLVFQFDEDTLIAQRLLVPFPNVEKLILAPAFSNTSTLVVNREKLIDVIKRVRVNADPDYMAVFLSVVPVGANWSMVVRARDRTGNTAQELVDAIWQGDKIPELCVNHKSLVEFLESYTGEDCIFKVGDDKKSALFLEDKVIGFTGFIQQMNPSWF